MARFNYRRYHKHRRQRFRALRWDGPRLRRCRYGENDRYFRGSANRSPTYAKRGVATCLLLAFVTLPVLASCRDARSRPIVQKTTSPDFTATKTPEQPVTSPPPASPHRTITFRGLDNPYHGTTAILPDDRPVHQKEPHD
jgi:hypothetical protein